MTSALTTGTSTSSATGAPPQKIPTPSVPQSPAPVATPTAATPRKIILPLQVQRQQTPSRWRHFFSEVLWRFLWQNIGWFIGGFCFVSGSVFLVAYSSGYAKALAVLGTLSLYAALLLWGGYQIRRKRSDLATVSQVLLILSVLLIPLLFATATRLLLHDQSLWWFSLPLVALTLMGALFSVRLASGALDRPLLQGHPSWFMALSALQFCAPLLQLFPHWSLLAVLHLVLLLVLGLALQRFTQHWLRALFVDQRALSYYAAGTLIFAALVSFIHLTWSNAIALPAGYNGGFLMALSLLLFNVDRHLKQWVEKKAWLDRVTFLIYALSSVAVLLAWLPGTAHLGFPWVLSLTLALGALLYWLMLWHYLTLPPLYLLVAAGAGEYALLLRPFPADAHFLLSLPGVLALLLLRRFLLKRKAAQVVQMLTNMLLGLIPLLVFWSLWQAQPGWAAMLTPLSAALILLPVLDIRLVHVLNAYRGAKPAGNRCYLFSLFVWLTLAYAPLFGLPWAQQFSLALLMLSLLWGLGAAALVRRKHPRCHANVLLDSALLSLMAALLLAAYGVPMPQPAWLLVPAGAILLLLSLLLNSRALLYCALLSLGVALGLLIKHYQILTTGSTTLELGVALFVLVWWLERRLEVRARDAELQFDLVQTWELQPLRLWTLRSDQYGSRSEMLVRPLSQAMVLLWLLGLGKLASHFWTGLPLPVEADVLLYHFWGFNFPAFLGGAFFWGAFLTLLMTAYLRCPRLLPPLALLLWVISLLLLSAPYLPVEQRSLLIIGVSLLSWWASVWLVAKQKTEAFATEADHLWLDRLEQGLHHMAFVLIALALLLPLSDGGLTLLLSLLLTIVFWAHAGVHYQYPLHAYLVVAGVSLALLALYSLFADVRLWLYLSNLELGWLLTGLSVGLAWLGWALSVQRLTAQTSQMRSTAVYQLPLYQLAYVLFALALLVILPLLPWVGAETGASTSSATGLMPPLASFSLLLLVQSLALLPLLRSPSNPWLISDVLAAQIRGVLMPILLTAALLNLLVILDFSVQNQLYLWVGWAFVLWALSFWQQALGAERLPDNLRIAPQFAPWWGLLLIAGSLLLTLLTLDFAQQSAQALVQRLPSLLALSLAPVVYGFFALQAVDWLLLSSLALYLLLLLQRLDPAAAPASSGLRWSAAVALLLTGLVALLKLFPLGLSLNPPLALGVLGWLNLLLYLTSRGWLRDLGEQQGRIRLPLHELRQLATGLLMAFQLALTVPTVLLVAHATSAGLDIEAPGMLTLALSLLLSVSFAHLLWLHPRQAYAHWLLIALTTSLLLAGMAWLPLLLWLCAWLWLALVAERLLQTALPLLATVLAGWIVPLFGVALLNLFNPLLDSGVQLLALTLLGGFAISYAWYHAQRTWLLTGVALWFFALHWFWFWLLPKPTGLTAVLPWFSLQTALLAWLYAETQGRFSTAWQSLLRGLPLLPLLVVLTLSEWWLYLWATYQSLESSGQVPLLLFGGWDVMATSAAVLGLFALWLRHLERSPQDAEALAVQTYLQAANLGLLALFLRWHWVGWQAPTAWDTTAILGIAAGLVIVSHVRPQPAVQRLALLTPLLALFTVPAMSSPSLHASLTLFSCAALYLLMQRNDERQSAAPYLGLLALNLGVYVWIPDLASHSGLLQVYLLPAALSVLLMLHLHWLELKPSVAHAVRLTALSAIYASATLDVFLRPDFSLFLLALGLSFGGILLGIALRIKAFLYAGTVFLVLNVAGQLVQYYPEATLSKAIVLMLLGGIITGGMIAFQLQKDAIMRWINQLHSDLQTWE